MMRLRPDLQDAAAEAIAGQAVVDPLANQSPDHISETPTKEVLRLYPPISFLLRERISAACQTRRAWQPPPRGFDPAAPPQEQAVDREQDRHARAAALMPIEVS